MELKRLASGQEESHLVPPINNQILLMWNTVYNALTTKTLLNMIESLLDGSKAIQNPVGVPHPVLIGWYCQSGISDG